MLQLFKNKTSLLVFALLMWSSTILADPGLPGDGDPGSEPTVPVDNWIPLMLMIAIAIVFYFVYKKKAVKA